MQLTSEIQEKHPELLKYLEEMQDTLPFNTTTEPSDINMLREYLKSLRAMLSKYKNEQK